MRDTPPRSNRAEPIEVTLSLSPSTRVQLLDVAAAVRQVAITEAFPRVCYASLHTTAGYFEQRIMRSLGGTGQNIIAYLQHYLAWIPPDDGYKHDALHLRSELTWEQQQVESRNAHAHLVYIASGLSSCVKYDNHPTEPVYLVDLDGVHDEARRERKVRAIAYSAEEPVAQDYWTVPIGFSNDCVDLATSGLHLYDRIAAMIRAQQVRKGRVILTLPVAAPNVALTINEYEPLLIRFDLSRILSNRSPLASVEYAASRPDRSGRLAIPGQASVIGALYDMPPHSSNSRGGQNGGRSPQCALVTRRCVALLVSDYETPGVGTIVRGRYQSPILIPIGRRITDSVALTATVTRFV